MERTKITFAGITFTGFKHSPTLITVPKNKFRDILKSGRVRIKRCYSYTDDYAYDNATNFGKCYNVDPKWILQMLATFFEHRRPTLLAYDPKEKHIDFCPWHGEAYEITERH